MNTLVRYSALQLWHYWRNLSFRFKSEFFLLLLLFTAFFGEKTVILFRTWLVSETVTPAGLAAFVLNILLLLYGVTIPFIYFKLLPKQTGFKLLRVQPISDKSWIILLIISAAKYQTIPLMLMIPVLIGLAVTAGALIVAGFLAGMVICPVLLVLIIHMLHISKKGYLKPLIGYFLILIIYFGVFACLYFTGSFYWLYQFVMILFAGLIIYRNLPAWEIQEIRTDQDSKTDSHPFSRLGYMDFPKILRPLMVRELLVSLRNIRLLRLKILSMVLYMIVLIAGHSYFTENFINFASAVTLIFIWIHYSYQFNEKYVQPEIRVFIRTIPVKFFHLVFARIFSELIYVLILLILQAAVLLFAGTPFRLMIYMSGGVIIFASFLFYIIAVVRITFFHNPRLAGYAYHFLVIFSVMMIANFYLVGPVIILVLLVYITFMGRRQLA
jgi:hypothetical protein